MDPNDPELERIGAELDRFTGIVQRMADDTLDLLNVIERLPALPAEEREREDAVAHLHTVLGALSPLFGELRAVQAQLAAGESRQA